MVSIDYYLQDQRKICGRAAASRKYYEIFLVEEEEENRNCRKKTLSMENADKVRLQFTWQPEAARLSLIIRSARELALSTSSWTQSGGRGQSRGSWKKDRNKRRAFTMVLIKAGNC